MDRFYPLLLWFWLIGTGLCAGTLLELRDGWKARAFLDGEPTADWAEIDFPFLMSEQPGWKGVGIIELQTEFALPLNANKWKSPALTLGYIDRWIKVTLNGRSLMGDSWHQVHPGKPFVLDLQESDLRESNTLHLSILRKYAGGIYRGIPAIGPRSEIRKIFIKDRKWLFGMQLADLVVAGLFALVTLCLSFFERSRSRLFGILFLVECLGLASSLAYFQPMTNEGSHPGVMIGLGEVTSYTSYSLGAVFLFTYYRQKPPWWMIVCVLGFPASTLTTWTIDLAPGSVPILRQISAVTSLIVVCFSLWLIFRLARKKNRWALSWLIVFFAMLPMTGQAWLGEGDGIHPFQAWLWTGYVCSWSFQLLLLGSSIALIIKQTREAAQQTRRALNASEHERQRIARDLHDSVTQRLYAAKIQAAQLNVEPRAPLDELCENLDLLSTQIRHICHDLHQDAISGGLAKAIREEGATLARLLETEVVITADDVQVSRTVASHLFQIFQEALNNAIRHGKSSQVTVLLKDLSDHLLLEIQDNGKGFDPNVPIIGGIGLSSIEERAETIGAEVSIHSEPGQGTKILLRLSHEHASLADTLVHQTS